MRRTAFFVVAILVVQAHALAAQPIQGVALGARVRVSTADSALRNRQMYLLDVRPDSLALRDLRREDRTMLLRSSVTQLDVFHPARPSRGQRANLFAGYGALGCAVVGAAIPESSERGQTAVLAALGCAGLAWLPTFIFSSPGRWERAIP